MDDKKKAREAWEAGYDSSWNGKTENDYPGYEWDFRDGKAEKMEK